jgi:inositol phosphorylceramide mannosyltransferase catalytic subunit
MIPRHLIHIVPTLEALSENLQENLIHVARSNLNWKHTIFSDAQALEFVAKHYEPRYLAALKRIDSAYGPARSDLLRYLIMYQLGGVYLDNKSGLSKPLDDIVRDDDEFILCKWLALDDWKHENFGLHPELDHVLGGEHLNWVIITRPRHPFLEAVIQAVINHIETYSYPRFGGGKMGVLRVTGPIAYTLAIEPILHLHPHRRVVCVEAGLLYAASGSSKTHTLAPQIHYSRMSHPVIRPEPGSSWIDFSVFRSRKLLSLCLAHIKHWNRRRLQRRRDEIERI